VLGYGTSAVGGPQAMALEGGPAEQAPRTVDSVNKAAAILRRVADDVRIRPMTELDIEGITRIDERITKQYRPEVWEQRVSYYIRRDAESSQVAEVNGSVAGFMMGEVRGGEFGLEEPTGWIEFFGVDPDVRGRDLGRTLIDALLAHFRDQGAHIARTMVASADTDIAGFLKAMQFTPAAVTALEKRL
jgi:ribosomal protein S18 acetylase RimI-like enzyme